MSPLPRSSPPFCSAILDFSPLGYHLLVPRRLLQCQPLRPVQGRKQRRVRTVKKKLFMRPFSKEETSFLKGSADFPQLIDPNRVSWHPFQGKLRKHVSGSGLCNKRKALARALMLLTNRFCYRVLDCGENSEMSSPVQLNELGIERKCGTTRLPSPLAFPLTSSAGPSKPLAL